MEAGGKKAFHSKMLYWFGGNQEYAPKENGFHESAVHHLFHLKYYACIIKNEQV